MRKRWVFLAVLLVVLPLWSCAMAWRSVGSPFIDYENLSNGDILNLGGTWAGHRLHQTSVYPGQSKSQSFMLSGKKDFYGEVHLTWENAAGKKFEKRFMFTEDEFSASDIGDLSKQATVIFEFNQQGLIGYYTHRTPGAEERGKRSAKLREKLFKADLR